MPLFFHMHACMRIRTYYIHIVSTYIRYTWCSIVKTNKMLTMAAEFPILILILFGDGVGSIQETIMNILLRIRLRTSHWRRILPQNLGKIWSDTKEPRLLPKYSAKGSGAWRALTCPNKCAAWSIAARSTQSASEWVRPDLSCWLIAPI